MMAVVESRTIETRADAEAQYRERTAEEAKSVCKALEAYCSRIEDALQVIRPSAISPAASRHIIIRSENH